MLHSLYSFCFRLALPFVMLRLWWLGRKAPQTRANWQDRLGFAPRFPEPVIWVHAVSVGETIAAAPLVKALLARQPDLPVLMTAMTATGSERARALFGERVHYAFSPYDTPGAVRRFLDRVRPRALVIMETELWPNMIRLSEQRGIPIFLINARLSERSALGYERVDSLVRPLLRDLSWVAAQAEEDARRFLRIGAQPESVSVTGSIKFDVEITSALRTQAQDLRRSLLGEERPVWIAASTHIGEDEQILAAHQALLATHPEALLVIVPRHPERFDAVAELVQASGLSLARRSRGESANGCAVYLGDTMGELLMLYGMADLALVAGSLIERGGHNPLEPAAWGVPVLTGPHVFNFETIYSQLEAGGALTRVEDSTSLALALERLIAAPERRRELGANALAVVEANRGALNRVVEGIVARV
ncbi:MAG: lipid IV(A) 3-deoxy-D-manno-octulosonic acid transferase [Marinobacter sp.]|uniref:lipid IV(A) 3-deoxy-D-manno-octulosonic acid transferase n=1 Tax=Marinobacter sp. TaxID=50741 RepID=UPI00299E413A|nr:lipid IV(A) 3-deoxy-D-manno-octulosonic acid transferase [Marinobacter sp.]MDX1636048.1 lipid IV(A) 3-deoxy-D-manno-octulosonic acid transferase [Marinobacter sp.]